MEVDQGLTVLDVQPKRNRRVSGRQLSIQETENNKELSAPESCLNLAAKLDKTQATFYEAVDGYYKADLTAHRFYSADLFEDVNQLDDDINQASHRFNTADEPIQRDFEKLVRRSAALLLLVKVHHSLQKVDDAMEMDLVDAATLLEDADTMLNQLHSVSALLNMPSFRLIKSAYREKRAKMASLLGVLFRTVFSVKRDYDRHQLVVLKRAQYDDQAWTEQDVLKALNTMDLLEKSLAVFGKEVIKDFVEPLAKGELGKLETESTKSHAALRSLRVKSKTGFQKPQPETLMQYLLEVTRFIKQSLGCCEQAPRVFGKMWAGEFVALLKQYCMNPLIPDSFDQLDAFSETITPKLLRFEMELMETQLLPGGYSDLADFVANIYLRFTKQKRNHLLSAVRDIIMDDDKNTAEVEDATERGGIKLIGAGKPNAKDSALAGKGGKGAIAIDPSLRLPRMHVSVQAQTLVEMAYQLFSDFQLVKDPTPSMCYEVYYSVRDIFDMWRAIMLEHNRDRLEQDPQRAALFRNDCAYFTYHLTTMGAHHQHLFDGTPLKELCSFVDMIAPIRNQGEHVFRQQLCRQRDSLIALMDRMVPCLIDLSTRDNIETIDRCIRQLVQQLTTLSQAWKQVMSGEFFGESFGLIVDLVLGRLKEAFDVAQFHSSDQRHQLRYFYKNIAVKLPEWFTLKRKAQTTALPISKYSKTYTAFQETLVVKIDV